jgi:hypothetical protein
MLELTAYKVEQLELGGAAEISGAASYCCDFSIVLIAGSFCFRYPCRGCRGRGESSFANECSNLVLSTFIHSYFSEFLIG